MPNSKRCDAGAEEAEIEGYLLPLQPASRILAFYQIVDGCKVPIFGRAISGFAGEVTEGRRKPRINADGRGWKDGTLIGTNLR